MNLLGVRLFHESEGVVQVSEVSIHAASATAAEDIPRWNRFELGRSLIQLERSLMVKASSWPLSFTSGSIVRA